MCYPPPYHHRHHHHHHHHHHTHTHHATPHTATSTAQSPPHSLQPHHPNNNYCTNMPPPTDTPIPFPPSFYNTQLKFPGAEGAIIRVRVTPIAWRHLKELYALGETDRDYRDAAGAVRSLCRDKAFVFTAAALHRREDDSSDPTAGESSRPLHLVWGGGDGGPDGGHSAAIAPLTTPDELRLPEGLAAQYADHKRVLWAADLAEKGFEGAELPASYTHVEDDHEGRLAMMQRTFAATRARRLNEVLRRAARRNGKKKKGSANQVRLRAAKVPVVAFCRSTCNLRLMPASSRVNPAPMHLPSLVCTCALTLRTPLLSSLCHLFLLRVIVEHRRPLRPSFNQPHRHQRHCPLRSLRSHRVFQTKALLPSGHQRLQLHVLGH
jgi:hypothetical protein